MEIQLSAIAAGARHETFALMTQALSQRAGPVIIRAGFAFATRGGVKALVQTFQANSRWQSARKEFLVGIHQAITEPAAIDDLRQLPNSSVRVFVPGNKLDSASLMTLPLFHPKVVALAQPSGKLLALHAGSANLTAGALSQKPRNYECCLAVSETGGTGLDPSGAFDAWWTKLWRHARLADSHTIRKYAALRATVLQANPMLRAALDVAPGIDKARNLCIEVGAGSGPPGARHQVEFSAALSRFFARPARRRRNLTLRSGSQEWVDRPLSHKRTTYGVDIWRLGMPTVASGGVPIAERALLFRRTADPGAFEFAVADAASSEWLKWWKTANLTGHVGSTRGARPRMYGFF